MTDLKVETYYSENAPVSRRWIGFIIHNNGQLPVWFRGETEEEVIEGASKVWEDNRQKREENIRRREEGRKKAAETKRKKAMLNVS